MRLPREAVGTGVLSASRSWVTPRSTRTSSTATRCRARHRGSRGSHGQDPLAPEPAAAEPRARADTGRPLPP